LIKAKLICKNYKSLLANQKNDIFKFIAAQVQFNRGMLFDKSGAYHGHPAWKPLKLRAGKPLLDRGTLRKSMAPSKQPPKTEKGVTSLVGPSGFIAYRGNTITVGTRLHYAKLMNFGTEQMPDGKLTAKDAKALKIPVPQGKRAGKGAIKINKAPVEKKLKSLQESLKGERLLGRRARIRKQIAATKNQLKNKKFKTGSDKFIFRKSVKIPARRFDQWNDLDQKNLNEALKEYITNVLNDESDNPR